MNPTDVAAVTLPHRHTDRGPWHPGRPDPEPVRCPGCGSPLGIDPAGSAEPDGLVGTCPARQCGEVVVYRVCERRLIVADRRKPAPRR
jgi:hypothetical protein